MSFVRPKSSALACFLAASLAGVLLSASAGAAKQPAPESSGLKAQVAQGGRVELAAPSMTTKELASLRPQYERLKPRARSNAE